MTLATAFWWRLASGPLSVDMVTPWLTAAIEERFGGQRRVEVGGTQIELTEEGNTALRLRDIVVRDRDGAVVASAPKAEVGISGSSLMVGNIRPQRLSLIGAAMAVRVEGDGRMTVFAGADKRPFAISPPTSLAPAERPDAALSATSVPAAGELAILLSWLDQLDALGLDGRGLTEVGLKNGSLTVDDRRSGKQLTFENINLSLTRSRDGGIAFAINSTGADGPWSLAATVMPHADGQRGVEMVARDISPKDLALALRLGDGKIDINTPISGLVRAEFAADGETLSAEGKIVVGAGHFGDPDDPSSRVTLDEARFNVRWDTERKLFVVPVEVVSGPNQISMLGEVAPPHEPGAPWTFAMNGGQVVLAAPDPKREPPLMLDRVFARGRFDSRKQRIEVEQGDIGGLAAGIVFSGALDFSGTETRLTGGLAGTPMTLTAMKRIWPVFVNPKLRTWVEQHALAGSVERLTIAVNAPLNTLKQSGPPVPDDGLSVEIVSSATVLQPFGALPAIHNADLTALVRGRTATVRVGRGTAVLGASGRKLALSNGLFEVPDTHLRPTLSRVRFRVDGPMDAAAELVSLAPLRQAAGIQVDPTTSRGTFTAQVALGMPLSLEELPRGSVTYAIDADISNLAIDRMVRNHKLEAASLRLSANSQAMQVKGDIKLGGTPLAIDYRKPAGDGDAELRMQGTLDNEARARFAADLGGTVRGPIPMKVNGRIGSGDRESRFAVEADLGQAAIAELLPGWTKPAGKPARATFAYVDRGRANRLEDIVIEGSGTLVKGVIELDGDGELVLANFPTFVLSDGDKTSLKVERASDGTMKVMMRGDVYDGRNFIKNSMSGPASERTKQSSRDLDLDIKVGALAGYNGEALRGVDLRLSRRAGHIRSFVLNAKLGQAGALVGDLRAHNNGHQVIFFETNDAGALFRFTDTYPRITGGQMWVTMDPPAADQAPQDGMLNVKNFNVRGEPVLERVASSNTPVDPGSRSPATAGGGVDFTQLQVKFTRSPGKLAIRDGVVRGPTVGATIEGQIDYARDDVHMRGTFVPAYALNNMFAQPPILGFFLGGGQNEGLFGITYQVVGPPHAPTLRINPMSTFAPGFLRKPFEFRGPDDGAARAAPRAERP